jgi:2-oxoglutarate ferredoxin oxidoreductase subunit beta
VFTYQGDGDLASIGTNEIIHVANRGEKFTTVFVNNAVYGMTGGQLAPTTMPNQVTTTTPRGRDVSDIGYPLRVAELLATIRTPGYVVRVAVHSPAHIIEAKRCLKKAFTYQKEARCFTFVEFLSTCPTNWGLTPTEATAWLAKNMVPYYKLGELKTPEDEE